MNNISKKTKIFVISAIMLVLPQIVSATGGLIDIIDSAFDLVTKILIPLAFALCLLYFFWGVAKYIRTGANSDKAAEEGKKVMVWGVVGLFVAFSIWGIIKFIQTELNISPIENVRKL